MSTKNFVHEFSLQGNKQYPKKWYSNIVKYYLSIKKNGMLQHRTLKILNVYIISTHIHVHIYKLKECSNFLLTTKNFLL